MLQAHSSRETRDAAREVKFLLSADRAAEVLDWARQRLAPDPHAGGPSGDEYRTTTIYVDTPDRAVYHRNGSYGRSKYRIRRYGASDGVFLERKLRTNGLLSKRRTAIAIVELERVFPTSLTENWPGRWFSQRLAIRRLSPVCQVSYRRHALVGMGPYGPMRLTFDDELTAQPCETLTFAADASTPVIAGQVIVEMKYCVDTPPVFRHLVQDFLLSPAPISKYRLAVSALDAGGPPNADVAAAVPSIRSAMPGRDGRVELANG